MRFEHVDEGQEKLPVQPVAVKIVRRHVRCRDDDCAMLEKNGEKTPDDHRVGDVVDREFVEAKQPCLMRHGTADRPDRISLPRPAFGEVLALAGDALMRVRHELVEMRPPLVSRYEAEENIHEHGFAPADGAVDIDALRAFPDPALVQEPAEGA